jgi:hypothetical protein
MEEEYLNIMLVAPERRYLPVGKSSSKGRRHEFELLFLNHLQEYA